MENQFDPKAYLQQKSGVHTVEAPQVDQVQMNQFDPKGYLEQKGIQRNDTLQNEFGTPGQQALAAIEEFSSVASLGLTDLALEPGSQAQQNRKQRRAANPGTSLTGGMLGGAALLGMTGGLAAPVEGALLARGVGGAAARAAAYGAEGALLSEGSLVSDAALGDPELNAQKVLSHLGLGIAGGAALGAASKFIESSPALYRAAKSRVLGKSPELQSVSPEQALIDAGIVADPLPLSKVEQAEAINSAPGQIPLSEALHVEQMGDKAKGELEKGLSKLKSNHKDIVEAGKFLEAETPVGMLTSDKHIQRLDYTLTTSPSELGQQRAEIYNQGYKSASQKVQQALGEGSLLSEAEVGTTARQIISDAFEESYRPIQEIYKSIEDITPIVPIFKADRAAARKKILSLTENKLVQGTPEAKFVNTFADGLLKVDNLEKFQNFISAMTRASKNTQHDLRHVYSLMREELQDLEVASIGKFAKYAKEPEIKQALLEIIPTLKQARKEYKGFRDEISTVGKLIFGDKKIHGFQDFIDKIESQSVETFAERIFAKDNSSALKFLNEKFPEAVKVLAQFEKQRIITKSTTKGVFSPVKALTELSKVSKELKNIMFTPEELKVFSHGKTYFDNFLENFNPSGSAVIRGYQDWFKNVTDPILHPKKMVEGVIEHIGQVKTLNEIEKSIPLSETDRGFIRTQQEKASKLSALAGYVKKATDGITSGSKAIFKGANSDVGRGATLGAITHMTQKEYDKQILKIQTLAMDPNNLMEDISTNTAGLYNAAPNIAQSMYTSMINAVMFLNSRIPKGPGGMFLTPEWKPSIDQKVRFERTFNAVNSPVSILKGVKDGSLTNYELEAVQTVHPKLLSDMRQQVMNQMDQDKVRALPYGRKLSLAKFLGQPLDENMIPIAIQSNQATFNAPQRSNESVPNEGRKNPGGALKDLDLSKLTATQSRREEG